MQKLAQLWAVVLLLLSALPVQGAELKTHVVFSASSPLASGREFLRRVYAPVTVEGYTEVRGLPLDQSKERFAVYVPAKKPADGYALLVFVPPSDQAKIPEGWQSVLDQNGVIFVSADDSGNETQVRTRRMPLALIAAQNIMQEYPVNAAHVFVAGFSGGSRVALRLALAYPDLFTGAILNAGSDPIGTAEIPLPPSDLFKRFQQSTRVVYVTGNLDQVPYARDNASMTSLQDLCVANVSKVIMWNKAHQTADEAAFSRALGILLAPAPRSDSMDDCRTKLETEVKAQLAQVEALVASGNKAGARQALSDLDAKFGGLAAPQSLVLDARLKALGN